MTLPVVELLRSVAEPNGTGPFNGMFALQQALRGQADWLQIVDADTPGSLLWVWCWEDRIKALERALARQVFVQGPNTLFIYSGTPRIDRAECDLLDTPFCGCHFVHTAWYSSLVQVHRGPRCQGPIVLAPYPVDPWPAKPLPAEYDLLIYHKSGNRPQLLEYLQDLYPRHVTFYYGQFKREELLAAASRSRCCAYLSDDDHGPVAQAELLLAGCPCVGLRHGAPYIEEGVNGYYVDRLPAGLSDVATPGGLDDLVAYLGAIERCLALDRKMVRRWAVHHFCTSRIVEVTLAALQQARNLA